MVYIDTNNYIKRIYHGGGDPYELFLALLEKHRGKKIQMVCDTASSRNFRKGIFEGYKAGRGSTDDPVYFSIYNNIVSMGRHFDSVSVIEVKGGEADDYIACQAKKGDVVVSNDKDLWHLTGYGVTVYINGNTKVDEQLIEQKFFSPNPAHILLYKTLVGDSSDNIPGKKGFGKVAYQKLSADERDILTKLLSDEQYDESDLFTPHAIMSHKLAMQYYGYSINELEKINTPLQDFLDANQILILQ
jgi:DNA polymerase-1